MLGNSHKIKLKHNVLTIIRPMAICKNRCDFSLFVAMLSVSKGQSTATVIRTPALDNIALEGKSIAMAQLYNNNTMVSVISTEKAQLSLRIPRKKNNKQYKGTLKPSTKARLKPTKENNAGVANTDQEQQAKLSKNILEKNLEFLNKYIAISAHLRNTLYVT